MDKSCAFVLKLLFSFTAQQQTVWRILVDMHRTGRNNPNARKHFGDMIEHIL